MILHTPSPYNSNIYINLESLNLRFPEGNLGSGIKI